MSTGKQNKTKEAYAARYKATTFSANRRKKLTRVLKEQPLNEQAKTAISDIHYRRKTPNTSVWSASAKREAHLISSWPKQVKQMSTEGISAKHMFSLKARLHMKRDFLFSEAKKLTGLMDWNTSGTI